MRGTLTHRLTIEHHQETGETVDDGAGGTIPKREWVTVVEDAPCRFEPAGQSFIQGYVREDQGGRIRKSPRVSIQAHAIGEMAGREYELDIGTGDDWRLTLEGISGVFSLVDPDVHYAGPSRPSHVVIELERTDSGGS